MFTPSSFAFFCLDTKQKKQHHSSAYLKCKIKKKLKVPKTKQKPISNTKVNHKVTIINALFRKPLLGLIKIPVK